MDYPQLAGKDRIVHSKQELEFERLYLESYELVYNYVRMRMGGDSEAEDVVAEAYLRAARAFRTFDPSRAKFSTWVVRIACNCMNSHWRKIHPTATLEDVPDAFVSEAGHENATCDRDLVDRLLNTLSEEEREIVLMKYREGYRNVDIAKELDMNASTVATKLFTALKKMRAAAENS